MRPLRVGPQNSGSSLGWFWGHRLYPGSVGQVSLWLLLGYGVEGLQGTEVVAESTLGGTTRAGKLRHKRGRPSGAVWDPS